MASIVRRNIAAGDSRYDVRYRLPDGQVRTRTFRTRANAKRFVSTVEADMLRGAWVDPREASRRFLEVAHEWLESNPEQAAEHVGTRRVGRACTSLASDWSRVDRQGDARSCPRSRELVVEAVQAAHSAPHVRSGPGGLRVRRRGEHPRRVPLSRGQAPRGRARAATRDQRGRARGPGRRARSRLRGRWRISGRCSGSAGAKRPDCGSDASTFFAGTLTVAEQVTRGPRGLAVFGPPKSSAGRRTLAVPTDLVEMLAAHLARRGLTAADPEALLFTTADGMALEYANFRHRVWLPACSTRRARWAHVPRSPPRECDCARARPDRPQDRADPARSLRSAAHDRRLRASEQRGRPAAADALGDKFARRPRERRAMDSASTRSSGGRNPR